MTSVSARPVGKTAYRRSFRGNHPVTIKNKSHSSRYPPTERGCELAFILDKLTWPTRTSGKLVTYMDQRTQGHQWTKNRPTLITPNKWA